MGLLARPPCRRSPLASVAPWVGLLALLRAAPSTSADDASLVALPEVTADGGLALLQPTSIAWPAAASPEEAWGEAAPPSALPPTPFVAQGARDTDLVQPAALLPAPEHALKQVTPYWQTAAPLLGAVPGDAGPKPIATGAAESITAVVGDSPSVLSRPLNPEEALREPIVPPTPIEEIVVLPRNPPLGYSGPSGVLPTEYQESPHFVPIEDRWRMGFPMWDRYGQGQPYQIDYPYELGRLVDPYDQNVLKGDYPIIGQHTFLNVTVTDFTINEYRQVPTGTTPFESTQSPFSEEFFGDPNQYFFNHNLSASLDLFHGSAAFKPVDWRLKLEPIFNTNVLDVGELGVVYPDVRRGTRRTRSDMSLEQFFVEKKLMDIGPDYDFMSVRAGSQPFVSDFRGFLFKDINRGLRLFGTRFANRDQFNAAWFDQAEKDTNSGLNTFDDRGQQVVVLNYFRQDFIFPGFTGLINFHYNNDHNTTKFDDNGFLVRPDPAGVFREHEINAYYIGVGTDGHIGRVNVVSQLY